VIHRAVSSNPSKSLKKVSAFSPGFLTVPLNQKSVAELLLLARLAGLSGLSRIFRLRWRRRREGGIMTAKKQNFEESLSRLEKIVGEMESGSLSLEKMIGHFEEGQGLIKFCSKKLNEVERKIEKLVKKDGETVVEPFDEDEESDLSAPEEGELF
jgi:exodeoxyribonuclease VII small subunit